MKIFLAQQNYHIGNFESNTQKIICAIEEAKLQGGDLIIFSELSVCGYAPKDFLEFDDFINKSFAAIDEIRQHADTIGVLVGAPDRNPVREGKDLFNGAFFLYEQEIPNYFLTQENLVLLSIHDILNLENRDATLSKKEEFYVRQEYGSIVKFPIFFC